MCLNPVKIKNPNFGHTSWSSTLGSMVAIPKELRPSTPYIDVPCGKCADCRNVYYNSLLQRALVESQSSYLYFVTLTYDNQHIPSLVLPNGEIIYFSDYHDIQDMVKRFRAGNFLERDFRYLCVNEYGTEKFRPHFHLLFFVSKKSTDDVTTPEYIRQILFQNLGRLFAINVGTRKNPVYEPLFTYHCKMTSTGLKSNYFVSYVTPPVGYDYCSNDDYNSVYIRTIRYLIGYVNKSSTFDTVVQSYLDYYSYDVELCNKLRYILCSRVRYSKGFGCGFIDGQKHYLPKISATASYSHIYYTTFVDNLPDTLEEFSVLYPNQVDNIVMFSKSNIYGRYSTLRDCLNNMTQEQYHYHCLLLKYFADDFSAIYNKYYRDDLQPTVSYLFKFVSYNYKYSKSKIRTSDIIDNSPAFNFLRKGVEDGLVAGVPYLAFPMSNNEGYTALCQYYRDRVTTFEDIIKLYERIGVTNYEEWQAKFLHSKSTKKANMSAGNDSKYNNSSEIICNIQKSCLNLRRRFEGSDLYRYLFK